jgi:hypothetical protein
MTSRGRTIPFYSVAVVLVATANPCSKLVSSDPAPAVSASVAKAPAAPPPSLDESTLAEAKKLCAAGDCQTAHERLGVLLPPGSPVRNSADYKDIETKWAKAAIGGAADDPDVLTRRKTLEDVMASPVVDASLKAQAKTTLAALPKSMPTPVAVAPTGFDAELANAAKEKVPATSQAAKAKALMKKTPKKARALLLPRIGAGKADPEEIELLADVCTELNDDPCVARMKIMLSAPKDAP